MKTKNKSLYIFVIIILILLVGKLIHRNDFSSPKKMPNELLENPDKLQKLKERIDKERSK